jgi:hypothetical protein
MSFGPAGRSPAVAQGALKGLNVGMFSFSKSRTLRVTTVSPWIAAVAAIIASSSRSFGLRCTSFAQARKARASISRTLQVCATCSSQASIASALAASVAGHLDASLNLSDRHRREVNIGVGDAFQPGHHGAMRTRTPQFGDNIRIEKVHAVTRMRVALAGATCPAWADQDRHGRRP